MRKVRVAIVLSSIVSLIICLINTNKVHDALYLSIFYPLFYLVFALPVLSALGDRNRGGRITVFVFLGLQWLRFVILPPLSAASGYFSTVYDVADDSSVKLSTYLCLFELVITSFLCCIILRYAKRREIGAPVSYNLSGNQIIYSLFFMAVFALFVFRGRGMYTFLMLSANVQSRASLSDRNLVLQALFEYGLTCFMIVALYFCYRMHRRTGKKQFFWLALLLCLLRICIISTESESRMAILYSVGVSLFLLPRLFPSEKKKIFVSIFTVGVIVIGLLTAYKTYRAFMYDSYADAIMVGKSSTGMDFMAYTLDSYVYGVKDVARNIMISKQASLSFKNVIADIVQNIFGLKYLIPSTGYTTIGAYNAYIYGGERISGHLYSAIAYGNTYAGFLLAPLATCLNILVVAFIERLLTRFKNLDMQYICCLIFVRSAASMFACFPLTLNYLFRTVVIGTLVVGGASLYKRRRTKSRTLQ